MFLSLLKLILQVFEHGNLLAKLFVVSFLSFLLTPFFALIWQFIKDMAAVALPDRTTFIILSILLLANTGLGIAKHLKFKTFDACAMLVKLLHKTLLSLVAVAIFQVMNLIGEGSSFFQDLFTISTQSIIFLYLGVDSIKLIYYLSGGKMPPPLIMERFEEFANPPQQDEDKQD